MLHVYDERIPNASGIYQITCITTGKLYIGSAINLRKRRKDHFGELQRNIHRNAKLQHAFNKYGPECFTFEVLELVLPMSLTAREQYWLDKLKPFGDNGYNIAPIAGSSFGQKRTPEQCKRIGAGQIGRTSPNKGRKMTPEQLEHHKATHRGGFKQSEETKRKRAEKRRGTTHTPETIEKIRQSSMGHPPRHAKEYILTSPEGVEYYAYGLHKFCKEHDLNHTLLRQVAYGKRKHHKGWTARYC